MELIQGSDVESIDPLLIGSLTWLVKWVNQYETLIKVTFDHPELISALAG